MLLRYEIVACRLSIFLPSTSRHYDANTLEITRVILDDPRRRIRAAAESTKANGASELAVSH